MLCKMCRTGGQKWHEKYMTAGIKEHKTKWPNKFGSLGKAILRVCMENYTYIFLKTFRYFYHKICISCPNMIYIFVGRRWTLKCDYELRKVPRQRTPPEGGIYATDVYIEQRSQTFRIPLAVYVKILYNIILYNILCRQPRFRAHGSMVITITFNLKTKPNQPTQLEHGAWQKCVLWRRSLIVLCIDNSIQNVSIIHYYYT